MSTFPTDPNDWKNWHRNLAPYLAHPFASAVAIVPVFYGMVAKSALQCGLTPPKMSVWEALIGGIKVSRVLSVMVGTQMIAQNQLDKMAKEYKNFCTDVANSMVIGAVSAPALVVFNGYSMKKTALQSLKGLSWMQVGAIMALETSFLFSLRVSLSADTYSKKYFGDSVVAAYFVAFASGGVGSLIGHPFDTVMTRSQKQLQIKPRHLYMGAAVKAVTLGLFSGFYKLAKEKIEPK